MGKGPTYIGDELELLTQSVSIEAFLEAYRYAVAEGRARARSEQALIKAWQTRERKISHPKMSSKSVNLKAQVVKPLSPMAVAGSSDEIDQLISRLQELKEFKRHQEMLPPQKPIPQSPPLPDLETLVSTLINRVTELLEVNKEQLELFKRLAERKPLDMGSDVKGV